MKISFDLDDTIIPSTTNFETEPIKNWQKFLGFEKIRKNSFFVMTELKKHNHQIGIYTTSFRNPFYIRLLFLSYGIPLDFVINQNKHDFILKNNKNKCSKYPPAFNIDLHIDDSDGLAIEAKKFDFKVLILKNTDDLTTILQKIDMK